MSKANAHVGPFPLSLTAHASFYFTCDHLIGLSDISLTLCPDVFVSRIPPFKITSNFYSPSDLCVCWQGILNTNGLVIKMCLLFSSPTNGQNVAKGQLCFHLCREILIRSNSLVRVGVQSSWWNASCSPAFLLWFCSFFFDNVLHHPKEEQKLLSPSSKVLQCWKLQWAIWRLTEMRGWLGA